MSGGITAKTLLIRLLNLPFPPCIINATASKSIPGSKSPVDEDGCLRGGGTCLGFSISSFDFKC